MLKCVHVYGCMLVYVGVTICIDACIEAVSQRYMCKGVTHPLVRMYNAYTLRCNDLLKFDVNLFGGWDYTYACICWQVHIYCASLFRISIDS